MSEETATADLGPSNGTILTMLNEGLALEHLTHTYYVQTSELYNYWGYGKLAEHDRKEAVEEQGHAERVMRRLLFLGGTPDFSRVAPFSAPQDPVAALHFTYAVELKARDFYIQLARQAELAHDYGTRELADDMIEACDEHCLWADTALRVIGNIGLDNYLQAQL